MSDELTPLHVLADDLPCSKCGGFLDTGLECTECGHDMRPEIYPEEAHAGAHYAPARSQ